MYFCMQIPRIDFCLGTVLCKPSYSFIASLRDKMQEQLSLLSETTPVQRIEPSGYFLEAIAFAACKAKKKRNQRGQMYYANEARAILIAL